MAKAAARGLPGEIIVGLARLRKWGNRDFVHALAADIERALPCAFPKHCCKLGTRFDQELPRGRSS
jgi:hypothetical protein